MKMRDLLFPKRRHPTAGHVAESQSPDNSNGQAQLSGAYSAGQ